MPARRSWIKLNIRSDPTVLGSSETKNPEIACFPRTPVRRGCAICSCINSDSSPLLEGGTSEALKAAAQNFTILKKNR